MRHVQELVTMFETIHHELEIESVWFIKKSRRGDGFQRWHQDLVGIGTTVATIVVNIDSVDKEDEEFEVEKIRQQVGTNVKVRQQVGSDVKVRDTSCPDEAEESINKDKGKQEKSSEVAHVKLQSFRFSTAIKAPVPDLLSEYARRVNERMNTKGHSKSETATEVMDIDDRKRPPESVNKVLENLVIASEAVDIGDQKRPPEIGNEVMENVVTATEAVDIDDQDYEWNTRLKPTRKHLLLKYLILPMCLNRLFHYFLP